MKYGKWFLSFALVCLVVTLFGIPGALAETTEDGWEYQISDGNVTITGYSGTDTVLTIPSMIDENPVTAIGALAFYGCTGLTSVTIPDSAETIGTMAFYGCTGLTSVTIPDSVTEIGVSAFNGCTGLESITIPDSVTTIAPSAFYGCTGLTSIDIPDSVTEIGAQAFYGCTGLTEIVVDEGNTVYHSDGNCLIETQKPEDLLNFPGTLILGCSNSVIPDDDSVTKIGTYAFYGCTGLTSIDIPANVTMIALSAFQGCTGLESITIDSGVEMIGQSAFEGCTGLESITIPDSVTTIAPSAFYGCTGLTEIGVDEGNTVFHSDGNCVIVTKEKELIVGCSTSVIPDDDSVTKIGQSAFNGCTGLESITIPDSVTTIGQSAFQGCTGLESITIPDSVTTIEQSAFQDCTGLESITIPDSVTTIGTYAFQGCTGLESITIPGSVTDGTSVTTIGISAFNGCTGLEHVSIGSGVKTIGMNAFYGCTGLTSVTISSGVTTIEQSAFQGCTGLVSVTIGSDSELTTIGYNAFNGCTSLTSITIPDSVTEIGPSAFNGCTGLEHVTIGSGVKTIGTYAFQGCTGLESITIPGSVTDGTSVTTIGISAFNGCTGLEHVTIGSGVKTIGNRAFDGCTGLVSVNIGSVTDGTSGTTIGDYAFYGCTSLERVTIGSGVTTIGMQAFYGCTGLKRISIPDSVTAIWTNAFYGCSGLTEIGVDEGNTVYHSDGNCLIETATKKLILGCSNSVIPADGSVTTIGANAFYGCAGLTSIDIPANVTEIQNNAFYGCSGLTEIGVDEGNTVYHSDGNCLIVTATKKMILGCSNSVIPADGSVTMIGDNAFYGCTGLERITIPACVTEIQANPFRGCSGLKHIEVAEGNERYHSSGNCVIVTKEKELIVGCSTSVIPDDGSVTSIHNHAFQDCTSLVSITIPDTVTVIRQNAFDACTSLERVIISKSVTEIEEYAFNRCSNLSAVYYNGTADDWNRITFKQGGNNALRAATRYYVAFVDLVDEAGVTQRTMCEWGQTLSLDEIEALYERHVTLYTDEAHTAAFDLTTAINENLTLYVALGAPLYDEPVIDDPVIDDPVDDDPVIDDSTSRAFTDLAAALDENPTAWWLEATNYVIDNGLMKGVGDNQFQPNGTATRAMLVTILYRLDGSPDVSGDCTFSDVPADTWYTDAVIWASENGIVNGLGDGTFGADEVATREQIAVIFYRFAQHQGMDVSATTELDAYPDSSDVSVWALDAMKWANASGLMIGRADDEGNTVLAPDGQITRTEMAVLLYRWCTEFAR